MGSLSCNVEVRGHCSWNRVVRSQTPLSYCFREREFRSPSLTRLLLLPQTTLSIDVVPQRAVTKAMTGGIAFFVGKTLDINPRVKLGKLPVKVCRGFLCSVHFLRRQIHRSGLSHMIPACFAARGWREHLQGRG